MVDTEGETPNSADSAVSEKSDRSENDLSPGLVFDNRYELLRVIGVGATGTVNEAHDHLLLRKIALKIIHKHLLASQFAIDRFKSEGSISTSLLHPNIVKIYNQGIAADGRLYMVMEFLEGESLASKLCRENKLQLDSFFEIFLPLCDALIYAHEKHVIHRDIKPNNIICSHENGASKPCL